MPEQFHLVATKTFLTDLQKVPPPLRRRVEAAIQKLRDHPFHGRKLEAVESGQWRIRVGDYRLRYDVVGSDVILHRFLHRKDIYRR